MMRVAVAGGTGLTGALVVAELGRAGHEPVVLSRSRGADLTTGAGLAAALGGCAAVIDVRAAGRAMANGGLLPKGEYTEGKQTFDDYLAGVRRARR